MTARIRAYAERALLDLSETDTTDPKTDEIFALDGFVVITRKSTQKQKQYPIGDGSAWVEAFARDLVSRRMKKPARGGFPGDVGGTGEPHLHRLF